MVDLDWECTSLDLPRVLCAAGTEVVRAACEVLPHLCVLVFHAAETEVLAGQRCGEIGNSTVHRLFGLLGRALLIPAYTERVTDLVEGSLAKKPMVDIHPS